MEEKTKICYRCKRELPVTSFHKSNGNKDGLQYECKDCRREMDKSRRTKNRGSNPDLQKFTPRQLMEELKDRGFTWDYMLEPQKKIFFNKI